MKTVLSVGQCRPDQAAISHYLVSTFGARVLTADLPEPACTLARDEPVDLVLINRVLDLDGSDGMEILKALKSDPATADLPVMLVSNYADWQTKAVQAGALPGFGKAQLSQPATREKLAAVLDHE